MTCPLERLHVKESYGVLQMDLISVASAIDSFSDDDIT